MQPKRIVIVTGAHLCRNPRVVKEAKTLGEAGYEVSVVAPLTSDSLMDDDAAILANAPFDRVVSLDVRESRGLRGRFGRARRRIANEINHRTGAELSDELGYGVRAALRKARSIDADLFIGHQETGAWVCWKLMQEGRRVAADLEDWYSRDLLPEAQRGRPVRLLDRCERDLVRNASYVVTTSNAMADSMADAYGKRPDVVYNAFPFADRASIDGLRKDRLDDRPSLFWFSQTIGPGRGLEALVDAVRALDLPVQLHLRGNVEGDYKRSLLARFGDSSNHDLLFHALVPPPELLSRIAEHDVGFALEDEEPPSRDLTITNKILQYLQGGLAVVATPTSGQREVFEHSDGAVTLSPPTERDLSQVIQRLLADQGRLGSARMAALDLARTCFCWEMQADRLLALVDGSLRSSVHR
jgi:glycosyltransferase involved in cell wall biosynthesis